MIRGISTKRFRGSSYIGPKDALAKSIRRPHLRQYSSLYRPTFQNTCATPWLFPYGNRQGYHHGLYNSNTPREYHPNLNAPAFQSEKYVTDTNWESHHIPHTDEPQFYPPFPDTDPVERPVTYEQSKMMSEFFLKQMENQYQGVENNEEISSLGGIRDINCHSDPEGMGGGLVERLDGFAGNERDIGLPASTRATGSTPEGGGQTCDMMHNQIGHAIDLVSDQQTAQEMEMDPFQMQYDPYAIAQHIFDDQMQYMSNPLLMPMPPGPPPGPMPGF